MATPLRAISAIPASARAFGRAPKTKTPDSTAQRREAVEEGRDRGGSAEPIGEQEPDMSQRDEQAGEAEKGEVPVRRQPPAFKTERHQARHDHHHDIGREGHDHHWNARRARRARSRSRAAINNADAKASRAAGEIPAGPGCATRKAPAKPTKRKRDTRRSDTLAKEESDGQDKNQRRRLKDGDHIGDRHSSERNDVAEYAQRLSRRPQQRARMRRPRKRRASRRARQAEGRRRDWPRRRAGRAPQRAEDRS